MSETPPPVSPALVVGILGVTQIIGYGTLYYAFALLAPSIGRSFDVGLPALFGIFSVALLLGGFAAPAIGRALDRFGAAGVMAAGSLAATLTFLGLSVAPTLPVFAVLILLSEVVAVAVQYDSAFALLVQLRGAKARTSITHLTLIAAFASTLFWPLTGWLVENHGWRTSFVVFALLHGCIALPLHLWLRHLLRRRTEAGSVASTRPEEAIVPASAPSSPIVDPVFRRRAFQAVAVSFSLVGALVAAIAMHLVPVLQALGLGTAAYTASMFMGPAQMMIRLIDAVFWRGFHPVTVAIVSASAMPFAIVALVMGGDGFWVAAAFAVLFGVGQGLTSIVRGTVPLALFGAEGFGARQGQLAMIRTLLSAAAPFAFSLAMESVGVHVSLTLVACIGILALLPLVWLHLALRQRSALPA